MFVIDYINIVNHTNMERFVNYYLTQFEKDLKAYYDMSMTSRGDRYPFIGFMSEPLNCNKRQYIKWSVDGADSQEHIHMFSAAIFHTSLFPQVIGKLYGVPAMEDFLAASGWPWMNCGLGGLMSPVRVVLESELRPGDDESEAYKERFLRASGYLTKDFLDFFALGAASLDKCAHAALLNTVDVQKMKEEIDAMTECFLKWIDDPQVKYESLYVPLENYPKGW